MMGLPSEHDAEELVIQAIQARDRCAFEELVRRHHRWVRSVAYGVLGRPDRVDDVVQQVWATVWERIGELRDPASWRAWLYRLTRNAALDAGREASRHRSRWQALLSRPAAAPSALRADGQAVDEEVHAQVLRAIEGLPAIYREPFVLRHMNDWSYQQIAEVMGMPLDTVETRLVRARRLLREALKDKAG